MKKLILMSVLLLVGCSQEQDYSSKEECKLREAQQCPTSDSSGCFTFAHQYCNKKFQANE